MEKIMLSVDDLIAYTGFSRSHVYKLTSGAKIPHYKPGKKLIFFRKDEIDQWLQGNKIESK